LKYVRIGQPATLTSDLYGGAVTYHGTVIGLGPGTGSAFALLPPAERDRQLDQDRAAAAGAHSGSTRRSSRRTRCGSGLFR